MPRVSMGRPRAAAAQGCLIVAVELPLEDAVDAASLLLGAQLACEVGLTRATATTTATTASGLAMLTRGIRAPLHRALGGEAALALQV